LLITDEGVIGRMNEKSVIRVWFSRPSNAYYNMSEEGQRLWVKLAKKYKELGTLYEGVWVHQRKER